MSGPAPPPPRPAALPGAAQPRIELHLHLEGAAPPAFVAATAAAAGAPVPDLRGWRDFQSFLDVYMAVVGLLDGPSAFGRLTEAVLAQSAAQGIVYTELFVCPDICGPDPGRWAAALSAISEAAEASPVETRLIATAIRHLGPAASARAAQLARDPRIVGFGLAGEERGHPASDHARAFDIAREAGLGLTVHAGELAGPASVADALTLGPSRIGHGVRAIEDPELVARLADLGTVLEVCPGSNLALGLYPDLAAHPIGRLRAAGVAVTVSTDDPPYFGTDMVAEFAALAELGWSETALADLNRTAVRAAFADPVTKARLETLC